MKGNLSNCMNDQSLFIKLFKPQMTVGIKYEKLIKTLLYLCYDEKRLLQQSNMHDIVQNYLLIYNYNNDKFDNDYLTLLNNYKISVNDLSKDMNNNLLFIATITKLINCENEAIIILNNISNDIVWKNTMLNWTTYMIYLMSHYYIKTKYSISKNDVMFPCRNRLFDLLPKSATNNIDNNESLKKLYNILCNLKRNDKKLDEAFYMFFGKTLEIDMETLRKNHFNKTDTDDKIIEIYNTRNYGPFKYGVHGVPFNENIVVVEFRGFVDFAADL